MIWRIVSSLSDASRKYRFEVEIFLMKRQEISEDDATADAGDLILQTRSHFYEVY